MLEKLNFMSLSATAAAVSLSCCCEKIIRRQKREKRKSAAEKYMTLFNEKLNLHSFGSSKNNNQRLKAVAGRTAAASKQDVTLS